MGHGFQFLEHTADIGIAAYGKSLEEVFVNAAKGLFSLIVDTDSIMQHTTREIELEREDVESLLVSFLNELIYIFDTDNMIFSRFEVLTLKDNHLKVKACGEKVDPSRHELKLGPKAATFHKLEIKKLNGTYEAQIFFDI